MIFREDWNLCGLKYPCGQKPGAEQNARHIFHIRESDSLEALILTVTRSKGD